MEAMIRRLRKAYKAQEAINTAYRMQYISNRPPPQWAFDAIKALKPGDLGEKVSND